MFATFLLSSTLLFSPTDTIGVYAVDTETGEVLFDENSTKSLTPASTLKIVTTATALHLLGPEYRFQTHLEYDGSIKEGTLHGNLYIRGGGDPCLGSDRLARSWQQQIEEWTKAIQKQGIHTIEGHVIGDATQWESALAVPSWLWEDLGNYYGAGACALSFNENLYRMVFRPGNKVGDPATVLRTEPPVPGLHIQNEVKTGPMGSGDRACIYGSEYSPFQIVRGTIPAGVPEFSIKGAIPDPARFCADSLAQALQSKGITIKHQSITPAKRVVFHTTSSPPLKEIVYWANQKSINLYAEHLLKKMGEMKEGEGSTLAGIKAIKNFWQSQNVEGFHIADGSGLSRKNQISARQLVAILLKMKNSELFPIFLNSLPKQNGSIRAKSGTMSFVNACVGYSGKIAFAIMINQCLDQDQAEEQIERFLSAGFDKKN